MSCRVKNWSRAALALLRSNQSFAFLHWFNLHWGQGDGVGSCNPFILTRQRIFSCLLLFPVQTLICLVFRAPELSCLSYEHGWTTVGEQMSHTIQRKNNDETTDLDIFVQPQQLGQVCRHFPIPIGMEKIHDLGNDATSISAIRLFLRDTTCGHDTVKIPQLHCLEIHNLFSQTTEEINILLRWDWGSPKIAQLHGFNIRRRCQRARCDVPGRWMSKTLQNLCLISLDYLSSNLLGQFCDSHLHLPRIQRGPCTSTCSMECSPFRKCIVLRNVLLHSTIF